MKGIGLDNKDLGRFWNAVCPEASVISRQQFKLFCKYCAVFHKGLPFNEVSFSTPLEPIVFVKNSGIQAIGQQAVDRLMASRAASEYQQPKVPQPIVPSNTYSTNFYGNSPAYGHPDVAPQPSAYTPPPTFQSQVVQPHVPQPQSHSAQASSAEGVAAQFTVAGTNANRITPEDYVIVKQIVENIPAAKTDEFTFDELKSIILAFKVNNKEATRIWKLVDLQGKRVISREGKPSLTRGYFFVLSASSSSQGRGSACESSSSIRKLHPHS